MLLALLALGACGQKEEPAVAVAAPVVFEPPAAGKSPDGEIGVAAEQASGIHPVLTERPPEDAQAPGEPEPEPALAPASASEGVGR